MPSFGRLVLLGAVAVSATLIATPLTAAAAPIACSTSALISAIAAASGGGSVTLASGCVYTLTAANNSTDGGGGTGLPVITGTVTIAGSGATIARSTASGTPTFRIFDVAGSGNLSLDSLTLSNGLLDTSGSTGGAGIYNHGTLSVSASTFNHNSSPSPNGVSGGAISNSGQLTITTTTFTNNQAQEGASIFNQNMATVDQTVFANNDGTIYGGGGVLNAYGTTNVSNSLFVGNTGRGGGAIDNDTTMTLRNTTFYNNSDNGSGGGAVNNFGTMTFIQSTFSGNKANTGANIHNYSYGSVTATTTLIMSILANPVGGANCVSNGPPIIDGGYNLDSGTSCGFTTAQHALNNTDPQLGPLASNGGSTQTMALPATSAAVNAIPTSVSGCNGSTDQRGITRPQGAGCDIGAFELVAINDTIPPTVPTGLTAPTVTASAVSLQWGASTDDTFVTGYTVYRNGTSVGTTAGATATTYSDTTVLPSTTYSYTVDAVDAGGLHSAQSAPLSVTTQAGPPPPPPPPPPIHWVQAGQVGTGSSVTSTTLSLTGAVHAGDLLVGWFGQYNSTGQVKVSDNINGAWTRGASETWSSTGDLALYYVQNAAASPSGVTITVTSTTGTYLEAAVSDYSGVATTGALDTAVVATGNSASVDSGATAAVGAGELVVGGIITGGSPSTVAPGATQGQAFTMRAQRPSGSVDIEDVLSSAAGTQNARATFGKATDWHVMAAVFRPLATDTQAPTVPAGLTATASSTVTQVNLAWNASTDNVGVTGYTVYRNGSVLAGVSGTTLTYADNTVASLATYSYAIDAFDAAGNHSAQSSAVSVTTPDTSPPTAPAGLTATAKSPTEVDLSWAASTDNVGVTGYTVYRGGVLLTTTAAGVTTWADTTVVASTGYSYTVDAFDAAGNHSAPSAPATATTPAAPDTQAPTVPAGVTAKLGTAAGEVDVAWSASTDNVAVTGYTIYRDGTALGTVAGTILVYADHTAAGMTTYSYTVDAFDAAGNHSAQSVGASITTPDWTPPSAPTGLTATLISNGEIDLSWSASTDNVGVTGYTVYRNGAAIATTAAGTLVYADTGVGHGFTYSYTVDAFDAAGNHSASSAPASATTLDDIPPTTPGGLAVTATSPTAVAVSWTASTDNVAVSGYGVYRDSTLLIALGPSALSYTDTVTAGSTHSYTVDAVDAAGNRSGRPTAITVTTSITVSVPKFIQGAVVATGSRVTSVTLTFGPVAKGDLLVGWFGQYDSAGQVSVSDNVNGAWTRSASTTWHGSAPTTGDVALYYFANSAAASGLTITIVSPAATYLQGSASEFSGVAAVNPLDQVVVAKGSSTSADSGLTAAVGAGELVYGGMTATNGPGTLTAGTSQGVAFTKRVQNSSGSQGEEDIPSSAAGQQHAGFTFPTSTQWFMVCAVFKHA